MVDKDDAQARAVELKMAQGARGLPSNRTKGANCGCIIPWTLRKISKRYRKEKEKEKRREGRKGFDRKSRWNWIEARRINKKNFRGNEISNNL